MLLLLFIAQLVTYILLYSRIYGEVSVQLRIRVRVESRMAQFSASYFFTIIEIHGIYFKDKYSQLILWFPNIIMIVKANVLYSPTHI